MRAIVLLVVVGCGGGASRAAFTATDAGDERSPAQDAGDAADDGQAPVCPTSPGLVDPPTWAAYDGGCQMLGPCSECGSNSWRYQCPNSGDDPSRPWGFAGCSIVDAGLPHIQTETCCPAVCMEVAPTTDMSHACPYAGRVATSTWLCPVMNDAPVLQFSAGASCRGPMVIGAPQTGFIPICCDNGP